MGAPLAQLPEVALRAICSEKDLPEVPYDLRDRLANRIAKSTATSAAGVIAQPPKSPAVKAAALVVAGTEVSPEALGAAAGAAVHGVSAWALGTKLAVAGLVAFTLGSGAGAAVHAFATHEPLPPASTPIAVQTSTPAQAGVAVSAGPLLSSYREVPNEQSLPSAPVLVTVTEPPRSSARAPAAPADPLRRERSLLDTARMAVLRGDRRAATDALSQHAREFPDGQHAADRRALEARAEALPE